MRYKLMTAAFAAAVALPLRGSRLCHRPRGHALVDVGRRSRGGRRIRQGVRRHRQQMGRRRHRRRRRHRASDHDQPHHRRRPDGRHPVQPRPPGRGTGPGGPDARPHRSRHQGELGRARPPEEPARQLHARRQDLLRAGQHPFLAVAVAVQQGLRGRRRAGSEELGRVRRRRARARKGRQDSAGHRRPALADDRRLQRADGRRSPARTSS